MSGPYREPSEPEPCRCTYVLAFCIPGVTVWRCSKCRAYPGTLRSLWLDALDAVAWVRRMVGGDR